MNGLVGGPLLVEGLRLGLPASDAKFHEFFGVKYFVKYYQKYF